MSEVTYDRWLVDLFDHPDSVPDWYFADDHDFLEIDAPTLTAHVLRLFEAPGLLLTYYSDQQITSGLKFLIDPACGGDIRLLTAPNVPHTDRMELARKIDRVYSQIFAARCTPALGHLSEVPEQPLNMLCYMWWDTIWFEETGDAREDQQFREELIETLGRILALPHAACQEGALHGLGHWGDVAVRRTEDLIDRFLAENRAARPELIAYAQAARGGCIL